MSGFRASWGAKLRIAKAQPGGTSGQFGNGTVAMATSGSWYVANVKQNAQARLVSSGVPWDVAPVPRGPKRRAALAHELGIGIPSGVRNQDASWAGVRYLTSPAALVPFARIGRVVPPQKSLWKDATPADNLPAGFKRAFLDMWDEIELEPPFVPRWPDVVAIWQEELDAVWKGERPAREGAAAFKSRMDQHLKQLKAERLL
ncbi:MAG: extracellular solute-binding protein [Chloroflexi bacterium]|nr:extracellular solute-binding protein [Chloroflexota bacterium]